MDLKDLSFYDALSDFESQIRRILCLHIEYSIDPTDPDFDEMDLNLFNAIIEKHILELIDKFHPQLRDTAEDVYESYKSQLALR